MSTPRDFLAFCAGLGVDLAPFQRKISRAAFGPEREVVCVLPRGSGKTELASLLAVHHLVTVADASVSLGAASREQATVAFEAMKRHAEHPALAGQLTVRHLALRADRGGRLRVVSGRGERAHGQTDSLMLADELWCWPNDELLSAFETAMLKRADARLLVISTAAAQLDSPLGRLRARALAGEAVRRGAFLDARAPGLHLLEWSLPNDADPDDITAVKRVNPAPWISLDALREQHARCTPLAWQQFHCCRWGVGAAQWLPHGAWSACKDTYEVEPGEPVVIGVDVGGSRAASAVVAVTDDLRVAAVRVFQGDEAVLQVSDAIRELADSFTVREVAFDPWRFQGEALRLQADGLVMVQFPQSHSRMVPASERLHAAIVERRLRHHGDPDLDQHVAHAVAKATGRGWRLDKLTHEEQIDAVIALAMAVERAEHRPAPVRLLGWI